MLIDSHAHLLDSRLYANFNEVRSNYLSNGVKLVVEVGHSVNSSKNAKILSENFSEVYFTAGCHPDDAGSVNEDALTEIESLSKSCKCLAIGEIGLDYHYLNFDKQTQLTAFEKQLRLAVKLNKPVVIHSRDAWSDTIDILTEYSQKLKGFLMHCYSGSLETAKILSNLGGYFAFGGVVTFKNAKKGEILKSIPLSRILLETDCPYMAPVPHRGELNQPSYVSYVYQKVADELSIDIGHLENEVENNFKLFFNM